MGKPQGRRHSKCITQSTSAHLPEGRVPISRGSAFPHQCARVRERRLGGSVQGRHVLARGAVCEGKDEDVKYIVETIKAAIE